MYHRVVIDISPEYEELRLNDVTGHSLSSSINLRAKHIYLHYYFFFSVMVEWECLCWDCGCTRPVSILRPIHQ